MFKKAILGSFLCAMLLGSTYSANAATFRPATQELMSRAYPIIIGNQFNYKNIDATDEQLIAKDLDAVIINKSGDMFVDNGANADIANQIRALNPKIKVLQYLNLIDVWDSQTVTYPWMVSNNVFLYDDNKVAVHPYQSSYGTHRWAGDPTNPIWQNYYANRAKSITDQGMDGIFSDNWFRSNAQNWAINATRFSQVQAGWETVGQKTKSLLGDSKILIGNGPAYQTYQSRDGAMIEMRNAPDPTSLKNYLAWSDQAASYGQINLDAIQATWDNSDYMHTYDSVLNFSLPACLLTDNIYAITNNTNLFTLIEKVGKIGTPKAPRYRGDGILERDFTGGKVFLNDTSAPVTVNLTPGLYVNLDGAQVNSITLPSFRGTILKISPIPAPPSNLTMSGVTKGATSGSYYVNLSWTDNSVNETGYEIYQSINDQNNFQLVSTQPAGTSSVALNLGTSPADGTYYYKVLAVNSNGRSAVTNIVTASIKPIPVAPSNLTVQPVTKADGSTNYTAGLTWTDNSSNETGFNIYQSKGTQDNFQLLTTLGANITAAGFDLGASPTVGTNYYKITAVNTNGESAASSIVPLNISLVPSDPTNLAMTGVMKGATSGNYYVNLSWTDNATTETAYQVYQSFTDQNNFQLVSTLPANSTTAQINLGNTPTAGAYNYKVVALNDVGKSNASNIVATNVTPTPADPTNLTATGLSRDAGGNYSVNLTWSDNASNETGYEIYKSVGTQDNFQLITTTGANATSFADNIGTAPTVGTVYYKVDAINAGGKSQPSNIASFTVNPIPAAPTNLTVTSVAKGAVSGIYYVYISWTDNSNNETGFQIYQSIGDANNFKPIKSAASNTGTFGISLGTNPTPGIYYFKIVAVNSYGASTDSNIISVPIRQ